MAGTVSGPGATHVVQPGDPAEDWIALNGAVLQLMPQSRVLNAFATDARLEAEDARLNFVNVLRGHLDMRGGTLGYVERSAYAALINNSVASLDQVDIESNGTGIRALRAGTDMSLSRSTLSARLIGVDAEDRARVRLWQVDLTATNSNGIGIRMADSRASVTDSRISAGEIAVSMTNSEADVAGSILAGRTGGLVISTTGNAAAPAQARLEGSTVTAAAGTAVVLSGASTLALRDSHLRGTGANGRGVLLQGGGALSAQRSSIEGNRAGLRVEGSGITTSVMLDGTRITSTNGDAVQVAGSLSGMNAITLRNGASLGSGTGVLLRAQESAQVDLQVHASHLAGDLVAQDDSARLDVTLRDGATLAGRIDGGRGIALHDAQWQMTGDSRIGSLLLGPDALLALGRGDAFHTLAISGDFTGDGGTLLFNTVLDGDDAATDRLVIGGDTRGTAHIRVTNVGGTGAVTPDGIELISVGGTSHGHFTLVGRAVGGQYEYFLHKGTGADGSWYLRSALPTPPDPCDVDPASCSPPVEPVDPVDPADPVPPLDPGQGHPPPPPHPDPVIRPEGGAYLANLRASQDMFRIRYDERNASQNSGRAWARVDGTRQRFNAANRQLDIHGNSQALGVGADLWRTSNGNAVGVMLSSGNATSTSTNPLSGYYARGKVKGEALGVYGTWRAGSGPDPYRGFYVDGTLQRAQFRNRVEGVGLETERYGSRAWQGALETGRAFRIGGTGNSSLFLEQMLQVGYNRWDGTRHTEANGTAVATKDADGLFGHVGLRLSGLTHWEGRAVQVQPYVAVNWLLNRSESQISMDAEVVTARIPSRRAEVKAGASLAFTNGMALWAGLARQQASGFHQTSAQLGVNYHW
ncbi:autotransporter outer membrane beta-barrel domain-containing protein [Stenotrophomonas maltophilia]|uniref:autotransporter family protein n=1 Tax=Stenotrophomonas maltophilia TaxID=40324 RepID=UPI0039F6EE87